MKIDRTICWTPSECSRAREFLGDCVLIASDVETIPFKKTHKHTAFMMTVNSYTGLHVDGSVASFCFPFQDSKHPLAELPTHIDTIHATQVEINDLPIRFTGQNFIYDMAWYLRYGMPVRRWAFDSMIMFWARYPELPKTLDFISSILLDHYIYWKAGRKDTDFIAYMHYGMSDTEYTLFNTLKMIPWLEQDERIRQNFFRAHTRCLAGLGMSMKGFKVHEPTLGEFSKDLGIEADRNLKRVRYLVADESFNPNSPQQKSDLIYRLLGAKKRNAKGRFVKRLADASTGKFVLQAMRSEHPLFRRVANAVLNAMEPAKQLSNVVGIKFIDKEGGDPRFITQYDGVGTTTTRFSSRASAFGHGSNAQNIRKSYRKFAVADRDSFLLEIDFSAADDVHVAFESEEPKKIELFESGKDMHAFNASEIFFTNWTYEEIVAGKKKHDPRIVHPITGIRQINKKLVHGCHYLMAGLTLLMSAGREAIVAAAKELGHADAGYWNQDRLVDFCAYLEAKFRDYYPRFQRSGDSSWYTDLQREVRDTGGFTTTYNYYQRFLSNPNEDSTLRAVAATAGQANTAGRINMAMDELCLGLRTLRFRDGPAPDATDRTRHVTESTHGISMRAQTHDSITFNVNYTHPKWQEGVNDIFHVFRRPVMCKGRVFCLNIEAEVSYRWAGKESVEIRDAEEAEKFLESLPRDVIYSLEALTKVFKAFNINGQ